MADTSNYRFTCECKDEEECACAAGRIMELENVLMEFRLLSLVKDMTYKKFGDLVQEKLESLEQRTARKGGN